MSSIPGEGNPPEFEQPEIPGDGAPDEPTVPETTPDFAAEFALLAGAEAEEETDLAKSIRLLDEAQDQLVATYGELRSGASVQIATTITDRTKQLVLAFAGTIGSIWETDTPAEERLSMLAGVYTDIETKRKVDLRTVVDCECDSGEFKTSAERDEGTYAEAFVEAYETLQAQGANPDALPSAILDRFIETINNELDHLNKEHVTIAPATHNEMDVALRASLPLVAAIGEHSLKGAQFGAEIGARIGAFFGIGTGAVAAIANVILRRRPSTDVEVEIVPDK